MIVQSEGTTPRIEIEADMVKGATAATICLAVVVQPSAAIAIAAEEFERQRAADVAGQPRAVAHRMQRQRRPGIQGLVDSRMISPIGIKTEAMTGKPGLAQNLPEAEIDEAAGNLRGPEEGRDP